MSPLTDLALSRREFLARAALGTVAARSLLHGAEPGAPAPKREELIYVGTYTHYGKSKGIYLVRMAHDTGALTLVGAVAETTEPSFVALSPDGRLLYAVNETEEYEGRKSGAVSAFARDRTTGALTFINRVPSGGGAPCYITFDATGKFVLVANYVGGSVAVFPVRENGSVGDATAFVQHVGHGPDAERQEAPHAHCIIPDGANRFALVADLGLDRVRAYAFDASAGTLSPAPVGEAVLAAGAGPRHLALHPNGRIVYVVNELDSTISTLRYDPATGALAVLYTVSTVAGTSTARNAPADVHIHPSGKFLYMSNRGRNTIAAFAIDAKTSALRPLQFEPTGGDWPRNFAIDPSGRFLFVAHEHSSTIVTHRIDAGTGRLAPTHRTLALPAPVCLRFLPRSAPA